MQIGGDQSNKEVVTTEGSSLIRRSGHLATVQGVRDRRIDYCRLQKIVPFPKQVFSKRIALSLSNKRVRER